MCVAHPAARRSLDVLKRRACVACVMYSSRCLLRLLLYEVNIPC